MYTCSHQALMNTCSPHVHMQPSCTHAALMYTCSPHVHMQPSCTHAALMYTCSHHVHMQPSCTRAAHMYTCSPHVHMQPSGLFVQRALHTVRLVPEGDWGQARSITHFFQCLGSRWHPGWTPDSCSGCKIACLACFA